MLLQLILKRHVVAYDCEFFYKRFTFACIKQYGILEPVYCKVFAGVINLLL